jgi:hypothetical protein
VTYPPIFARLYEKFDKPIIVDIPIRYEYGAETCGEHWAEWNDWLDANVRSGKMRLVANSRYDQHYTRACLGHNPEYIPSLCAYTGAQYNPVRPEWLYSASFNIDGCGSLLNKHSALRPGYRWPDVTQFAAMVWFPYNASLMSIFEQYTANMPIFVPSPSYMMDLRRAGYPVMQQCSWQEIGGREPRTTLPNPLGSRFAMENGHDPNNYRDVAAQTHWWQYADFYQQHDMFPHITQFGSLEELGDLMRCANLPEISYRMRLDWERRRSVITGRWAKLIGGL